MHFMNRARLGEKHKCDQQWYQTLKNTLFAKNWAVSVRDPVKDTQQVLDYLARYTHRVAITNRRIKELIDATVTLSAKNRKQNRTEVDYHQRGGFYPQVPAAQPAHGFGQNPSLRVFGQSQPAGKSILRKSLAEIASGNPNGAGLSRRDDVPANGRRYQLLPLLPPGQNALFGRNPNLPGASANPTRPSVRWLRTSLFYQ